MKILIVIILIAMAISAIYLVSRDWKRVWQIIKGWGIYNIANYIFDYPIWQLIIGYYGELKGSIIASAIVIIFNFGMLIWYQKNGTDWLGVNIFEELKITLGIWSDKLNSHAKWYIRYIAYIPVIIIKSVLWVLNTNDIALFIFLSCREDSFVATAFLRHGRTGKLEKRDYIIFTISTIFSCLWWSGVSIVIQKFLYLIW